MSAQPRIGSSGAGTGAPKAIAIDVPAEIDPEAPSPPGMTVAGTRVLPLDITGGAGFIAAVIAAATGSHLVIMPEFDARECVRLVGYHKADWMAATRPVLLAIEKPRHWPSGRGARQGRDLRRSHNGY